MSIESIQSIRRVLEIFSTSDGEIRPHFIVTDSYDNNSIGARLINTFIHQYFIHGGLKEKESKKASFQRKLSLETH